MKCRPEIPNVQFVSNNESHDFLLFLGIISATEIDYTSDKVACESAMVF